MLISNAFLNDFGDILGRFWDPRWCPSQPLEAKLEAKWVQDGTEIEKWRSQEDVEKYVEIMSRRSTQVYAGRGSGLP